MGFSQVREGEPETKEGIRGVLVGIIRELIMFNIPYLKSEEVFTWCAMQKANMKMKGEKVSSFGRPVQAAFRLYDLYNSLENG